MDVGTIAGATVAATAVMSAIGALTGRYVTMEVRNELAIMREDIRKDMEKERQHIETKYLNVDLATARLAPLVEGQSAISKRLDELESFVHVRQHQMAQDLTGWLGSVAKAEHMSEMNTEMIGTLSDRIDATDKRVQDLVITLHCPHLEKP